MTDLPEPRDWDLEVVEVEDLSPGMRRVRFTGQAIGGLEYLPGQDMAISVPAGDGETVRRRYTIASLDRERGLLALDFVRHGDGPAARWAAAAAPGDRLAAVAPRGKVTVVAGAAWHLFAGDETALPAFSAMAGALGPGQRAIVILEVGDAAEERPIVTPPGVDLGLAWLHRGGATPGHSTALADALAAAELPPGEGHAYLAGEFGAVQAARRLLQDRGLSPARISPKPYWRLGRRNMPHGEPERD